MVGINDNGIGKMNSEELRANQQRDHGWNQIDNIVNRVLIRFRMVLVLIVLG